MQNKKIILTSIFVAVFIIAFFASIDSASAASCGMDGTCQNSCSSDQEEVIGDGCNSGEICCSEKRSAIFGDCRDSGGSCKEGCNVSGGEELLEGKTQCAGATPYCCKLPPAGTTSNSTTRASGSSTEGSSSWWDNIWNTDPLDPGRGGGTSRGSGDGSAMCSAGTYADNGICLPTIGLSDTPIADILYNLMQWLFGIFAFIAVIAFGVSGVQFLISTGDEGMLDTAKRNMKWSIVGVIVGLSGLVIIKAISAALEGWSPFF